MIVQFIILAIVMLIAIVLGLAEIFLFPGLTLAGLGGLFFAAGGLYYAYSIGFMVGNVTLIVSIIVFGIGIFKFMRSRSLDKMALHTEVNSRLVSNTDLGLKEGDEGITISRLAPQGRVKFGDVVVEAKSELGFLDEHTPVVLDRIELFWVIVRRK